ncbi:MAG: urease accessory UreF family protein [Pseudomonadota bacterium]
MAMPTPTIIPMIDPANLTATTRLAYWLSPAFPTGAFAYSHGLEYAFEANLIETREDFTQWLSAVISDGSGWADAVLCSLSWRSDDHHDLRDFALSLASCAERYKETTQQGRAFLQSAREWLPSLSLEQETPLPVCVGAAARAANMDHGLTVSLYLSSIATNLIQAALRMGRYGQEDGVIITAALEPLIIETAISACSASLEDIHSATVIADLAAIQHETLDTRIFAT